MISREEAIQRFIEIAKEEWDITEPDTTKLPEFKFINELYDSIGTCRECKLRNYCQIEDMLGMGDDWFCADFERAENGNSNTNN